jgi:large subunit ribosomal protein L35
LLRPLRPNGQGEIVPRNQSKPKLKLKTHRGAAKRFKITKNGKILRSHSGKRHILGTKLPKHMRHLRKLTLVHPSDVEHVRRMMPYA